MRLPNHIVLDYNATKDRNSSSYWVSNLYKSNNLNADFINNKIFKEKITTLPILKLSKYSRSTKSSFVKYNISNNNLLKYLDRSEGYSSNYYNNLTNNINLNFLRKERVYTKLKYSRSPAYDIVSGGAAAILAGLFGFLISEKFGMELVDSGDFYYLFMYLVFISFSVKPLITVSSSNRSFFNLISLKRVLDFYLTLFSLVLKFIK